MNIADKIASRVGDIPMLSPVITKLLETINNPDYNVKEIVKIIEYDAALTARILRIANSAYFFRGHRIESLPRAVLQLGDKIVVGIAVSIDTSKILNKKLDGYESSSGELWAHSLRTAFAAREIARTSNPGSTADLAFTAGLLHDIGKVVISEFLMGKAEETVAWFDQKIVDDYLAAERKILGTDHSEVGYKVAKKWGFSEPLCQAILHHHNPSDAEESWKYLTYLVHLGDIVSMIGGDGTGADAFAYTIDKDYKKYIKLDKDALALIILNVQEDFSEAKAFFGAGGQY